MLAPRFQNREAGRAASAEADAELPGIIADHTLIRCIGEGSYGRVYLARNELTGVYRALKIVFREAFNDPKPYLREFDAICIFEPISRSHPGFVQILHVGKLESAFYYIMEVGDDVTRGPAIDPETYVSRTLGLNRGELLPVEKCIEIGSSLADCLSVLHAQGLIHRDIKPSNIIFVNGRPKLADIGLVTQIEEAKSFVGTAGFMPPEGPVTPASDIYSLGKVLYEIATGKDRCEFPELPAETTAEQALHLELNQILLRACDPRENKRYRNAQELRRELDLLQAGKSIKRLRQVERRLRLLKFAFVGSAIFAVGAFLVYSQIEARREARERDRQRQAGYFLAEGTSEMRRGDLARALPFFLQAAEYDPRDMLSHQLRIGSVSSQMPRLERRWKSGERGDFSADGSLLVVPEGKAVSVFESATGQLVESHPMNAEVTLAKLSPDLKKLAVATGPTLIYLDRFKAGGRVEHTFDTDIRTVAFNPTTHRLAVALTDGAAWFYSPADGKAERFPRGPLIWNAVFDSSGRQLLTMHDMEKETHIRDGVTGEIVSSFPRGLVYNGVFAPGGTTVVVCAWGAAIPIKADSGELAGNSMLNDDAVVNAAYSPNGLILATANYDATIRLWDAKTFEPLRVNHILQLESRPLSVAFLSDETLVAHCIDGENYVWRLGHKSEPKMVARREVPDPLTIREEGVELVARGEQITGKIRDTFVNVSLGMSVTSLAVNPLRVSFAAGSKDTQFVTTYASLYHLNDLKNPIRLNHKDGINHIVYSHAGDKLATSSEDFSAIIWDATTGQRLTRPMRHRWQVLWSAFSPDDRWLVTAGWDAVCIVWDARTGEPLTAPLQFASSLFYVAFEPGATGIVVRDKEGSFFRTELPIATLPLSRYAEHIPPLLEPFREPRRR